MLRRPHDGCQIIPDPFLVFCVAQRQPGEPDDRVHRGTDVMGHIAQESRFGLVFSLCQLQCLFELFPKLNLLLSLFFNGLEGILHRFLGCIGTLKRLLQFIHVFRSLFVRDDKNVKKTVADETTESGKRRERPDDLKEKGYRHCNAEQDNYHASTANDILTATPFDEHASRDKEIVCNQKIESGIAQVTRLIHPLRIKIIEALVERVGHKGHEVKKQNPIPGE